MIGFGWEEERDLFHKESEKKSKGKKVGDNSLWLSGFQIYSTDPFNW